MHMPRAADPRAAVPARAAPSSTKMPLERANPLLSCAVSKWLRAHGKTVKPKLTEEQVDLLRTCFHLMDADGSGAIDEEELFAAFRLLGLSVGRREVAAMLAEVDKDGSGEVEYAEFLEIMTMQLTRLAQAVDDKASSGGGSGGGSGSGDDAGINARQQRSSQAGAHDSQGSGTGADGSGGNSHRASGSSDNGSGGGGGNSGPPAGGTTGAANAAVLPFDVVATAYRRKKLMEALEGDDKDFILSVAAAEDEERRKAEQEAEAAAARRQRHASVVRPMLPGGSGASGSGRQEPAGGGPNALPPALGGATAALAVSPQLPLPQQHPLLPSHAEFLSGLSKEQRRIIEAVSRKHKYEQEVEQQGEDDCEDAAGTSGSSSAVPGGGAARRLPPGVAAWHARRAASMARPTPPHLAALQATAAAGHAAAATTSTAAAGSPPLQHVGQRLGPPASPLPVAAGRAVRSQSLSVHASSSPAQQQQDLRVCSRISKSAAAARGTEGLQLPKPQYCGTGTTAS